MNQKPDWIRVKAPNSLEYKNTYDLIRQLGLNTVCEEAACPNIGECWKKKHAAVMILGSICTRNCAFCNVKTGKPNAVDENEPRNLAIAVGGLGLKHIVITSVDRDDLNDGGANHFAKCINAIRVTSPETTIEVLTPDFRNKLNAIETVVNAEPDVYNHNIETVPSLYRKIKRGASYPHSLGLLKKVKELNNNIFTKSGIILGMGEKEEELMQVMDDLRSAEVDFLTISQYLRPTKMHMAVDRYVTLQEFKYYADVAITKGFLVVSSSPLTRSSYHAEEDFKKLKESRQ